MDAAGMNAGSPEGAMPSAPERPEVLSSRVIHRGAVVTLRVDEVQLTGGRVVQREVVEHPGAVVVVALDDQECVSLVRQYRHPVGGDLLELPAGGLEPGEDPATSAARELEEETGLIAGRWDRLGSFYSSPGFVREELHAYLARDLRRTLADPDDDEEIVLVVRPLRDLLADPGSLADAKTLATLLLLERFLEDEKAGGPAPTSRAG
jgi:8-oxo-dGTP pyrophosphatase MutT (NUDIX family)